MATTRERALPIFHPAIRLPAHFPQPRAGSTGRWRRHRWPKLDARGGVNDGSESTCGKSEMDNVEWLSNAFNPPPNCSVESRLDALMDLGHLHDPRVVVFLLQVLADRREPSAVR